MKKLFCLSLIVLLFSCNSKEKNLAKKNADNSMPKEIRTDLYGSWVGNFVAVERDTTVLRKESFINKINIVIKKITADEVIGQSIVAGNNRPLKGYMKRTGNTFYFTLKEPGNDKNDGVFTFEIQKDTILTGTWTANNGKKEVTKRKFRLYKQEFEYNPNAMLPEGDMYVDYENPKEEKVTDVEDQEDTEVSEDSTDNKKHETYMENVYRAASESILKINSSTQKLKESDVKNLKKIDLEILRNTIFARHGLSFKTKTVRQFFDAVEWYVPISTNVDNQLTAIEKQNIVLLKRFEKYAEDNYDSFGR